MTEETALGDHDSPQVFHAVYLDFQLAVEEVPTLAVEAISKDQNGKHGPG
jgi:hypothetical protein